MRRLTATLALLAGGAFASPLDAGTANQTNATINPVPVTTQARDQALTLTQTLTQTAGVSRAIDHYAQAPEVSGDRFRLYGARRDDRSFELSERIGFEPFDPSTGTLEQVRLVLELTLRHWYRGTASDGIPLDEPPEPVSVAGSLSSRLDVIGPDGTPLASTLLTTPRSGCAGTGECRFSGAGTERIALTLFPETQAFLTGSSIPVILRVTSQDSITAQVCPDTEVWDECAIDHAGLRLSAEPDGIALHYDYRSAPAAGPGDETAVQGVIATLHSGGHVASGRILLAVGAVTVAIALLATAAALAIRRQARRRNKDEAALRG
ncbi:MAG: hypothetical protein AAFQ88_04320 [Pseudomonadota bacterium]